MTEEKKDLVHRVVRIAIVLWVGLMLLQCGGCGGKKKPTPTDTPEDIAVVAIDYDISRERAEVKAHIVGESDDLTEAELVTLPDSDWRDMRDRGRVWTDHVGRAELRAACTQTAGGATLCDCEAVILYEYGDLVARPCHPEQAEVTCVVGQVALNRCDICFETLSSRVCPEGTWVSITYLGASEITIVTVGEGAATVTPVTVLEYEEGEPLEFEFITREWSRRTITLEAELIATETEEAYLPFFLYTAPDANLERIKIQAEELGIELPPPGEPLPIDQLPILVNPEFGLPLVLEALAWEEPNLQLWMYDLSETVYERGDIIFPPFTPPDWDLGLTLDFDGEQLSDPRVQRAFVYAIDKEFVVAEAFPNEELPGFYALIEAVPVDAFTLPQNLDEAYALLDEVAFDRDQLVFVLFPTEDDQVAYAAKLIAGAISEIGIKLEPVPVPGEEMEALRQEYAFGQQPVIAVFMHRPLSCMVEAGSEFAALWEAYGTRLGCPLNPVPTMIQDAEQPFQNGRMVRRADSRNIYVIYEQGPLAGTYELFLDEWEEGDPEYSCIEEIPQVGLFVPKRGFGQVWCQMGGSGGPLGWALDEERGYSAGEGDPLVQDFEGGVIFRDSVGTESGMAYVLFSSTGTFEHLSY